MPPSGKGARGRGVGVAVSVIDCKSDALVNDMHEKHSLMQQKTHRGQQIHRRRSHIWLRNCKPQVIVVLSVVLSILACDTRTFALRPYPFIKIFSRVKCISPHWQTRARVNSNTYYIHYSRVWLTTTLLCCPAGSAWAQVFLRTSGKSPQKYKLPQESAESRWPEVGRFYAEWKQPWPLENVSQHGAERTTNTKPGGVCNMILFIIMMR